MFTTIEWGYRVNEFWAIVNKSWRAMKTSVDKYWYSRLVLWWKNKFVHRLVAIVFIPNVENKLEVNHKDGNKLNNFYTNLERVSHSDNMKHAYAIWLATKPTWAFWWTVNRWRHVIQLTTDSTPIKEWNSIKDIIDYNPQRNDWPITNVCNHKPHKITAYGFKREYKK
jgi:hypothetical protein